MKITDKVSTKLFRDIAPGGLCILKVRDAEYLTMAARPSGNTDALALTLCRVDAQSIDAAPYLHSSREFGGQMCLDVSAVTQVSSTWVGRYVGHVSELGFPYGALVVMGTNVYLACSAASIQGGPNIELLVDIRTGAILPEMPGDSCYVVLHWAVAREDAPGGWSYWIKADVSKFLKRA